MKQKEKLKIVDKNFRELCNLFSELDNEKIEYILFEKIIILIHGAISHKWIEELSKRKKIELGMISIFEFLRHFFAHNSIFNTFNNSYIDLQELKSKDNKNYQYFITEHKPSLFKFVPREDTTFEVYITIDFTKKRKHRIYLEDAINILYNDKTVGNNKEKMWYVIRIYQFIFEEYIKSVF